MIIHYMDDLLTAASKQEEIQEAHGSVIAKVQKAGLEISTSKIQEVSPWKYFGWKISEQAIGPQKIQLRTNIHNLQDLQKLLGEINWIRPILGITNDELAPLFDLLRGDCNIKALRTLTPELKRPLTEWLKLVSKDRHIVVQCRTHSFLQCWEKECNYMVSSFSGTLQIRILCSSLNRFSCPTDPQKQYSLH